MWYAIIFGYIIPAIICTGRATHEYVKMQNTLKTEADREEALSKHIGPKFTLGFVPIANIFLAIRSIVD